MSLIGEALKKARQEAARQDALHQGAPYAVGSADARSRRNPLLPVLAGLGAGCLFAGLLFAVAWGAGWGPFAKPQAPAPIQVAQTEPATPPPTIEEAGEKTPAVPPVAAQPVPLPATTAPASEPPITAPKPVPAPPPAISQAAPPPAVVPQAEPAAPPAAPPGEAPPQETPAAPVTQEPSSSPAPAASTTGDLEDGKVYTGEVPVPGGGSVKLNGIAYSQDLPVAVLDGRVMGPGEVIQGFTVIAIEAGRVKLQGYGATVYLSPR